MVHKLVPALSILRVCIEAKPMAGKRDVFRLKYRSVPLPPLSTKRRIKRRRREEEKEEETEEEEGKEEEEEEEEEER